MYLFFLPNLINYMQMSPLSFLIIDKYHYLTFSKPVTDHQWQQQTGKKPRTTGVCQFCLNMFLWYYFFEPDNLSKRKRFCISDCILKLRKQVQSFLYWSFVSDFLKLGEIEKLRTARFLTGVAEEREKGRKMH